MNTNLYLRSILICILFTGLFTGCSPEDMMHPEETKPDAALLNGETEAHLTISPQCSPSWFYDLTDNSGNTAGGPDVPTAFGNIEVANSPTDLYVIVRAGTGWQVSEACFWSGTSMPAVNNGTISYQNFPCWWSSTTIQGSALMKTPITNFNASINVMAHARLCMSDFFGNPANFTDVWAKGTPIANASYMTFAPVSCSASSSSSSSSSSCSVPTVSVATTANLAAWDCTPGNSNNSKVTVCHVPPGNPENRHSICIAYSALPAHVIDFKPANNRCMGHTSGCHIGPCDPCGPGSSGSAISRAGYYKQQYGCN